MSNFDSLSEKQREVADLIIQNAIDRRNGGKKLSQEKLGESVGVTGRTIRTWQKDPAFLAYLEHLSRLRIQAAMPDFAAVLITNLEKGQNLSTKQLDLIARVADWTPDTSAKAPTLNIQLGTQSIEDRIAQLEERKRKEVFDVPAKRIDVEEATYHETD